MALLLKASKSLFTCHPIREIICLLVDGAGDSVHSTKKKLSPNPHYALTALLSEQLLSEHCYTSLSHCPV